MGRLILVQEGGGENPLLQHGQFEPMQEWNRYPVAPTAFGSIDSVEMDDSESQNAIALFTSGYQGSQIIVNPYNPANLPGLAASQLNPSAVPLVGVTRYGV